MKKSLAFLFALLMLALAGCGGDDAKNTAGPGSNDNPGAATSAPTEEPTEEPKAGNHVVDYKIDVPDDFEPMDQEGLDACWFRADGSNINLVITEKDSTTDLGFKAITGDMLKTTLVSSLKDAYDVEPTITENYFTKNDVSGLPAYQYSYHLDLEDVEMSQIIVCINADKTYTFTFTASDDEIMETFETVAKDIQLTVE